MTNSIRKGKRAEREIVNILKDNGIPAKRISMMETAGEDKGDIEAETLGICQVKCGSHVPKTIYKFLDHEDIAFARRDREKWIVLIDLDRFISLIT